MRSPAEFAETYQHMSDGQLLQTAREDGLLPEAKQALQEEASSLKKRLDEMSSALKGAGRHGGHHHHDAASSGADGASGSTGGTSTTDALLQALSSDTQTNSDGSTTTTQTNADGSKLTTTTPASHGLQNATAAYQLVQSQHTQQLRGGPNAAAYFASVSVTA